MDLGGGRGRRSGNGSSRDGHDDNDYDCVVGEGGSVFNVVHGDQKRLRMVRRHQMSDGVEVWCR